ncbi:hypothetical protein JZ751_019244 [Albula glossodonta]|uniref:Transmembrane protein 248 n=1 Tax=Albula glossodonta TaxID=121402 RepID=A0A8T2NM52_9TELE|nr:hypothetical protein JZ751_019244 [Albula glossodonta]
MQAEPEWLPIITHKHRWLTVNHCPLFGPPFPPYPVSVFALTPCALASVFVGEGREAHEEMNITFTLPASWNSDDCVLHGHCEQVVFSTCMTITAASNVFPVTVSVVALQASLEIMRKCLLSDS